MNQSMSIHNLYSQIKLKPRYPQYMLTKLIKISLSPVRVHKINRTLTIHNILSPSAVFSHHPQYTLTIHSVLSPSTAYSHHPPYTLSIHSILSPSTVYSHHPQRTLTIHSVLSPSTVYSHHPQYTLTIHSVLSPCTVYSHHPQYTLTIHSVLSPSTVYSHHPQYTLTIHSIRSQTLSTQFKSIIFCKRRGSTTSKFAVFKSGLDVQKANDILEHHFLLDPKNKSHKNLIQFCSEHARRETEGFLYEVPYIS